MWPSDTLMIHVRMPFGSFCGIEGPLDFFERSAIHVVELLTHSYDIGTPLLRYSDDYLNRMR